METKLIGIRWQVQSSPNGGIVWVTELSFDRFAEAHFYYVDFTETYPNTPCRIVRIEKIEQIAEVKDL